MSPAEVSAAIGEALAFLQSGDHARAAEIYRQVIAAAPDAKKWSDLGVILKMQGRHEEAVTAYLRAIELDPHEASSHYNLGNLLLDQGRHHAAIAAYVQAVSAKPSFSDARINLGRALIAMGEIEEAMAHMREAVAAAPRSCRAHLNLGMALHRARHLDAAVQSYLRAIELEPRSVEILCNLGMAYLDLNQVEEAIAWCRKAIEAEPGNAEGYSALASCYRDAARLDDAITHYDKALALAPRDARHHMDCAIALLLSGQYERGWREYEWRWHLKGVGSGRFENALWMGERIPGRRLLLWGEQGLPDEILHAGMFGDLMDAGMHIAIETDRRLVTLLQRSFPAARVIARAGQPDFDSGEFDWQSPTGSLAQWLRASRDTFPRHSGYLKPDAKRVEELGGRLRGTSDIRIVGVSMNSTSPKPCNPRSIDLSDWTEILRAPGTRFVDLQHGDTGVAHDEFRRRGIDILRLGDLDLDNDIEGLAALCAACDLVITHNNVAAHVAGALGRPVWMLVPIGRSRTWHWPAGQTGSPWYPSMRIYSQVLPGSWREPIAQIALRLARLATAGT